MRSERLLLETYDNVLPPSKRLTDCLNECIKSRAILNMLHPILLKNHTPVQIGADGNCWYRSVSNGLFGSQEYHHHIRLLTAFEIAEYPDYYDTCSPNYVDQINYDKVFFYSYDYVLRSACSDGSYASMLHLYASSAAIRKPVKTYVPPVSSTGMWNPFNRTVIGRGVR